MPMTPGKDETQSEFMARCVPDMKGDGKRPQEQAVAACLEMWRAEKGGSKPEKSAAEVARIIARWKEKFGKNPSQDLITRLSREPPTPDEGETMSEYMDRCFDKLTEDDYMDEDL